MAASYRLRVERARAAVHLAQGEVFEEADTGGLLFSECLKRAHPETRAKYEAALRAVDEAEEAAIAKGRAYRGAYGLLSWKH